MKKYFCFMMTVALFFAGFFSVFAQKIKPSIGTQVQNPIAIIHARIIDGNGGAPIEEGAIVIQGTKIIDVGPAANIKIPPEARVLDAKGKTVMPALADMHVHLMGGWDGEVTEMLGYQRYLNALLYAGVTTVLDMGNVQPYVLQLRQEINSGRIMGSHIYCAGAIIDGTDPSWPDISFTVSSVEQIADIISRQKKAGVDIIKAYRGLSDLMLSRLVQEAKKESLRVFLHGWSLNGFIQAGVAASAHLPGQRISDEAIQMMKEMGIHCLTTLATVESHSRCRLSDLSFLECRLIKDTTPPWFLEDLKKEASRSLSPEENERIKFVDKLLKEEQKNAKRMAEAGILLAAGTDAPYPGVFQGEGIHRELELLVEAGFTPLEAISMATRNAALLMNAAEEWGTLAPGKLADILLLAGQPDKNISNTRNIEIVIQGGKILDRNALRFDPKKDPGFRQVPPSR